MPDHRVIATMLALALGLASLTSPARACENCELPSEPPPATAIGAAPAPGAGAAPAAANPAAGGQSLPQGHPPIEQHAPAKGTVVVRAVQGTPDGEPIGGEKLTLVLQGHGHGHGQAPPAPQAEIQTQLDEHGIAMIEDVEFRGIVQPVVTIEHAGVEYRAVGPMMSAQQPDQIVRVNVYDTTDQAPDWSVYLRHLYLQPTPEGVIVDEVMVLENPADRAWRRLADADNAATPATLVLPLPDGAWHAQLARGPQAMDISDEALSLHGPLIPGRTEIGFRYHLPLSNDAAELALTAPADTQRIMLFIPDDGSTVAIEGFEPGQTMDNQGQRIRVYTASDVADGTTARVRITPNLARGGQPGQPIELSSSASMRNSAIGGGLILLVAVAVLLFRASRSSSQPAPAATTGADRDDESAHP